MKIRSGFVSNSSSASFVLKMGNLTNEQFNSIEEALGESINNALKEHIKIYELKVGNKYKDYWTCYKYDGKVYGDTTMDNEYLEEWFKELGILQTEYQINDDDSLDWGYEDED